MEILVTLSLIFMIIAALNALETKDLLASVVSLSAVGFGLAVVFLAMGAPDVAIVQVVVEVLTLIILIRATIRHDVTSFTEGTEFFSLLVGLVLLFVLFLFSLEAVRALPPLGTPVMDAVTSAPSHHYLEHGLRETGSANIVTAILLDYRAYDTLGGATVLFASVLGALAVLRSRPLKKKKKTDDE